MEFIVYLAGPITGCSYKEAVDWREDFSRKLPANIHGMSPMRGKYYLESETEIKSLYNDSALSNARAITTRDFNDVKRADLLVVNMLGAERVSIGTVMEIAWAKAFNIPVLLVMEREGNIHEHAMISECIGFRVDNLDDAVDMVKIILLPEPRTRLAVGGPEDHWKISVGIPASPEAPRAVPAASTEYPWVSQKFCKVD